MSSKENNLAVQLLGLPASSRATLAEKLLSSLDESEEEHVEALWIKEAERRYNEIVKKNVKTKPAKKVFEDAYRRLR